MSIWQLTSRFQVELKCAETKWPPWPATNNLISYLRPRTTKSSYSKPLHLTWIIRKSMHLQRNFLKHILRYRKPIAIKISLIWPVLTLWVRKLFNVPLLGHATNCGKNRTRASDTSGAKVRTSLSNVCFARLISWHRLAVFSRCSLHGLFVFS